jgi:hypothetical protein
VSPALSDATLQVPGNYGYDYASTQVYPAMSNATLQVHAGYGASFGSGSYGPPMSPGLYSQAMYTPRPAGSPWVGMSPKGGSPALEPVYVYDRNGNARREQRTEDSDEDGSDFKAATVEEIESGLDWEAHRLFR